MAAALDTAPRITIDERTVREARRANVPAGSTLVLRAADGGDVELAPDVQNLLLTALSAIADHGQVSIGRLPDELTSTVAADALGVSRPTLLKWAREGEIASFTVGTHTRFKREEVLRFRNHRERQRAEALTALRDFDAEHDDAFQD